MTEEEYRNYLIKEIQQLKQTIITLRNVLRFCARNDVGTYYQRNSAKEMLLNSKQIVWSDFNPNGTYSEEYKAGIHRCYDKTKALEIIAQINKIETELLSST